MSDRVHSKEVDESQRLCGSYNVTRVPDGTLGSSPRSNRCINPGDAGPVGP